MTGDKYKYVNNNAPSEKINYSYSKYLGLEFIEQWKSSRKENLIGLELIDLRDFVSNNEIDDVVSEYTLAHIMFLEWIDSIDINRFDMIRNVNLLVKRFEVTKRIYIEYNKEMRPNNKENYFNIQNYCLFGIALGKLFSKTKNYQFLNAHLKINDILLGWKNNIKEKELSLRSFSFDLEYNNVIQILIQKNIYEE